MTMPTDFWEKALAGPLVEKWQARIDYFRKLAKENPRNDWALPKADSLVICRDELLAHLRECGICEYIEAAEAMRDVILTGAWPMKVKIDAAAKLDAAKRKLLGDVPCPDCERAAKHANSDGTTPGFFYDKCEKHREAK